LLEKNKNNESLTQQNESLTQQNESLTQQNESLTQKVDWVKSELKKASDINEQLIDELNKVYASNSWRVTKFLRYLRRL
jgi:cell division protein FtsB